MSEEKSPQSVNLEIQRQFGCQICFEPYSRKYRYPISLNCGHTFCLVCVRKLGKDHTSIQCGVCRKNTYSDYKKLGKNIGFSELLEHAQLLENDENREPGPDEVERDGREWEGPHQFISRSNLEEFFEELHLLHSMISNLPQVYNRDRRQFQTHIQQLEQELYAIQVQMRESSEAFNRLQRTLTRMHSELNEMVQNGPSNSTNNGRLLWDEDDRLDDGFGSGQFSNSGFSNGGFNRRRDGFGGGISVGFGARGRPRQAFRERFSLSNGGSIQLRWNLQSTSRELPDWSDAEDEMPRTSTSIEATASSTSRAPPAEGILVDIGNGEDSAQNQNAQEANEQQQVDGQRASAQLDDDELARIFAAADIDQHVSAQQMEELNEIFAQANPDFSASMDQNAQEYREEAQQLWNTVPVSTRNRRTRNRRDKPSPIRVTLGPSKAQPVQDADRDWGSSDGWSDEDESSGPSSSTASSSRAAFGQQLAQAMQQQNEAVDAAQQAQAAQQTEEAVGGQQQGAQNQDDAFGNGDDSIPRLTCVTPDSSFTSLVGWRSDNEDEDQHIGGLEIDGATQEANEEVHQEAPVEDENAAEVNQQEMAPPTEEEVQEGESEELNHEATIAIENAAEVNQLVNAQSIEEEVQKEESEELNHEATVEEVQAAEANQQEMAPSNEKEVQEGESEELNLEATVEEVQAAEANQQEMAPSNEKEVQEGESEELNLEATVEEVPAAEPAEPAVDEAEEGKENVQNVEEKLKHEATVEEVPAAEPAEPAVDESPLIIRLGNKNITLK